MISNKEVKVASKKRSATQLPNIVQYLDWVMTEKCQSFIITFPPVVVMKLNQSPRKVELNAARKVYFCLSFNITTHLYARTALANNANMEATIKLNHDCKLNLRSFHSNEPRCLNTSQIIKAENARLSSCLTEFLMFNFTISVILFI